MSNLTIEIKATELSQAILALAGALSGGQAKAIQQVQPAQPSTVQNIQPVQQIQQAQTTTLPYTQPIQQQAFTPPVQQQQAFTQPMQQQFTQPVSQQMPTQQSTYTAEQLAIAATQLVDAGKRSDLLALLQGFGVGALTQLPKERYGEFATALRQMGAKL